MALRSAKLKLYKHFIKNMNTRITALRLSKEEHDRLNQIAEILGYTYGGKGSIAKLLKAVAKFIPETQNEVDLIDSLAVFLEIKATKKEINKTSKLIAYLENNDIYDEIYSLTLLKLDKLNQQLPDLESRLKQSLVFETALIKKEFSKNT